MGGYSSEGGSRYPLRTLGRDASYQPVTPSHLVRSMSAQYNYIYRVTGVTSPVLWPFFVRGPVALRIWFPLCGPCAPGTVTPPALRYPYPPLVLRCAPCVICYSSKFCSKMLRVVFPDQETTQHACQVCSRCQDCCPSRGRQRVAHRNSSRLVGNSPRMEIGTHGQSSARSRPSPSRDPRWSAG